MEIKGSKVLVLGGYGQVGIAICRLLLINEPKGAYRYIAQGK